MPALSPLPASIRTTPAALRTVALRTVATALAAVMLLVAAMLLAATPAAAQSLTTKGTDFWLGFMMNFDPASGSGTLSVHITSDRATSGTVAIPGLAWAQTFNVPANGRAVVNVPETVILKGSDVRAMRGVHVTADDSVTVFALNHMPASADATVVLPTSSLSGEYMVVAYSAPGQEKLYPAEMMIVGVMDGTTVEITPTVATGAGRPAGVPYTVTLNAGEVYQIEAPADLTGTRVREVSPGGCDRFALFSGATRAIVGSCGYADHLVEQMFPLASWGRTFPVVPLLTKKGDVFRVTAVQEGTRVTIDGSPLGTLGAGKYLDTLLTDPHVIAADRPIAVAQFCRGSDCDRVEFSDPFMLLLSPFEQAIGSVVFDAFSTTITRNRYLNLITRSDAVAGVTLDGTSVAASFGPIPADPTLSYARIEIADGSHKLVAPGGVLASVYAFGRAESYGYAAGARVDLPHPAIEVASSQPAPAADTYCAGATLKLTGLGDATVKEWRWSIDPAGLMTGREVTLDGLKPGVYRITLIADRNPGCADALDSASTTITLVPAPEPLINPLTPLSLCQVDSVRLAADRSYSSYRWSNGATTPELAVDAPGTYTLTVTNAAGCQATSPPVVVTGPPSEIPVITSACGCQGLVLTASEGFDSYRWSTGETTRSIVVSRADTFRVTGTILGCDRLSAPIAAEPVVGAEAMTVEPRSFEAAPGDTLTLAIIPPGIPHSGACAPTRMTFTVGFDATLLTVDSVSGAELLIDTAIDGRRLVTVATASPLPVLLHLTAALGMAERTDVELAGFGWDDCQTPVTGRAMAELRMTAICRDGGTRLFDPGTDSLVLKPSRPDPASSIAEIEYGVIEPGRTELFVVDVSGRRVARLVDADLEPGYYRVGFDVSRLATGIYSYVLLTPTARLQRQLRVVR